jgi:hypothetical protein
MNKFILLVLVVCSFVFGGCARGTYTTHVPVSYQSRVITISVEGFEPIDAQEIYTAIGTWNLALNRNIQLVLSDSTHPMFRIIKVTSEDPIVDQADPRSIAFAVNKSTTYVVLDRLGTQRLEMIMLHEISHMLGAGHTKEHGLMFYQYRPVDYKCVDRNAVEQVARVRGLDVETMNWCY